MDLEDSFLDEDSEASYSDEDSLKSENSHDLYDEDASKRDSSSEGQAEMEDEDVLWNPKDIKMKDVPDDKPNIKDMIKKYITDPKNADCVVSVRGKEFRCHKLLLQCYSDHFKNCDSNYVELNFPSLTPDMFSELYSWMYGSPFSYKRILHPRTILDVLISAVDLGVRELEEQCWAVFNSKDVFNEETAYSMFLEAKLKSCDMVADIMLPRISKFFKHLAASDDFLKLPARHAADLLDSAHVSVPAEAHVLVAALRWLAHDWDARRQHAAAIMGCVRFQRMSPLELVVVRRSRRSATLQRLMELPEVQAMVEEGLQYAVLQMARGAPALPPGQLADLLDQLGLQRPKPRHYSSPAGDHDSVSELLEDLVQLGSSAPSSLTALSCSTVLRR